MGFAREWALPAGARAGLRAVGNAVPPPLAAAVMRAALDASPAHAGPSPPASPLASRPRSKRSLQAVADAAAGSDVDSEASEGSEASEASVAALLALLGSLQTSVRRLKRRVHALERGAAA